MTHQQEWTPRRGIIKGIFWGLFITLILSAGLALPAAFAPRVMTHALIRAFATVGVAWICFGVVQSAAGMVGKHTSAIAVTCTTGAPSSGICKSSRMKIQSCGKSSFRLPRAT